MAVSLLLLVSDESARLAYTKALRDAGCTVETAADSTHVYAAAVKNVPDVIVVTFDASLREDRFRLCRQLGADPRTRHVPILLTSTAVDQQDLERATSTGVLALALESHDAAKLVSAVRGVVAARLKPTALRVSLDSSSKNEPSQKNKFA